MKHVDDGGIFRNSVMVSRLPLLFSRGKPCSIEDLEKETLADFVSFLLFCALGVRSDSALKTVRRPVWWPRTMPYVNFNIKREIAKDHDERLRDLVRRCYAAADCCYLLELGGRLSRLVQLGRLLVKTNSDGTTALCDSVSGMLVVSCRNENVFYDQHRYNVPSSRRLLATHSRLSQSDNACDMVQETPPSSPHAIYLCDGCGDEFTSVGDVEVHERTCSDLLSHVDEAPTDDGMSDETSGHEQSGPSEGQRLVLATASQPKYLAQLELVPSQLASQIRLLDSTEPRAPNPGPHSTSTLLHVGERRRWRRCRFSLLAVLKKLDVSSLLGRRMLQRAAASPLISHCVTYERYCHTDVSSKLTARLRWPITWRSCSAHASRAWSHVYCFTIQQRHDRLTTIRCGLSRGSRRLLSHIRPCYVPLHRLPDDFERHLPPPSDTGASLASPSTLVATQSSARSYNIGREVYTDAGHVLVDICSSDSEIDDISYSQVAVTTAGGDGMRSTVASPCYTRPSTQNYCRVPLNGSSDYKAQPIISASEAPVAASGDNNDTSELTKNSQSHWRARDGRSLNGFSLVSAADLAGFVVAQPVVAGVCGLAHC